MVIKSYRKGAKEEESNQKELENSKNIIKNCNKSIAINCFKCKWPNQKTQDG